MSYTHKSIPLASAIGAAEARVDDAEAPADDTADAPPFAALGAVARGCAEGLLLGGAGVSLVIYFGTVT